jgi:anti-anti-sigma factor
LAAADGFRIESSRDGAVARLRLHGELDAATAPLLEANLGAAAAGDGASEVIVDCSNLEFIDSSGLSVLVANHKRLQDKGMELIVEAAPPGAIRLFQIAGIDRVLHIRDPR